MTPLPPAQQLGQALEHLRLDAGLDRVELGRKVGATQDTVREWETGSAVPGDKHWARIKATLKEARQYRVRGENDCEPPEPALLVGIGSKTHRALLALPDGWRTAESKAVRRAAARDWLRSHPDGSGRALKAYLVGRFGVAVAPKVRESLRRELALERKNRANSLRDAVKPVDLGPIPGPGPRIPELGPAVQSRIEAAVDALVAAVPGLRRLTVGIGADGGTHVEYELSETRVVIRGGRTG